MNARRNGEATGAAGDGRLVLDVAQVVRLERLIEQGGTPLAELMDRAGRAAADAVRAMVSAPGRVVVLAGSGNNGGDGWVMARELAQAGYDVVLVVPCPPSELRAEPARSTALRVHAMADALPRLRVLERPSADELERALAGAVAVADALLGTGFSGSEVREPYAAWIRAANGLRGRAAGGKPAADDTADGLGACEAGACDGGDGDRSGIGGGKAREDAGEAIGIGDGEGCARGRVPFALAVDVPSGLSAQTGEAASPCFRADATVTMLACKPGLLAPGAREFAGDVLLAELTDVRPFLPLLHDQPDA